MTIDTLLFITGLIMFVSGLFVFAMAVIERNDVNRRSSAVQGYCVRMIQEAHRLAEEERNR